MIVGLLHRTLSTLLKEFWQMVAKLQTPVRPNQTSQNSTIARARQNARGVGNLENLSSGCRTDPTANQIETDNASRS